MDVREARLVIACARAGTLTAAAQVLNVSQPAVSKTLAGLETRLGGRLFDRTGRRLALTPLGEALLPRAIALAQQSADLVAQARAWREGQAGALTLGAGPAVAFQLLPAALAAYYRGGRKVRLRVVPGASEHLIEQVRRGALDLAVCDSEPAEGDPTLAVTALAPAAIAPAVRPGHPALGGAPLSDFPVASATPPARMRNAHLSWPWSYGEADLICDDYAVLARVCAVSDYVLAAPRPVLSRLYRDGVLVPAGPAFDALVVTPGVIRRAGAPDNAARASLTRALVQASHQEAEPPGGAAEQA